MNEKWTIGGTQIDPDRFEQDFQREFGSGDEQPINYEPLDQEMIDAGHKPGDFA